MKYYPIWNWLLLRYVNLSQPNQLVQKKVLESKEIINNFPHRESYRNTWKYCCKAASISPSLADKSILTWFGGIATDVNDVDLDIDLRLNWLVWRLVSASVGSWLFSGNVRWFSACFGNALKTNMNACLLLNLHIRIYRNKSRIILILLTVEHGPKMYINILFFWSPFPILPIPQMGMLRLLWFSFVESLFVQDMAKTW